MSRRPYTREMRRYRWFMQQPRWRSYMLRETTAVVVAVYCCLLLAALMTLSTGDAGGWNDFVASQQHPGWLAWHGFALVYFIAFQTLPWFRLAPRAMPLELAGKPVPAVTILRLHYAAWLAVSLLVLWLAGVF